MGEHVEIDMKTDRGLLGDAHRIEEANQIQAIEHATFDSAGDARGHE